MSEQTGACQCEYNVVAEVPVNIYVTSQSESGATGSSMRTWESPWFDIAANQRYHFDHGLGFTEPWKCRPMLVIRTKNAVYDWRAGELVFADATNYNGATGSREMGWAITVSETGIEVTFANDGALLYGLKNGGYGGIGKVNAECKLVIRY